MPWLAPKPSEISIAACVITSQPAYASMAYEHEAHHISIPGIELVKMDGVGSTEDLGAMEYFLFYYYITRV